MQIRSVETSLDPSDRPPAVTSTMVGKIDSNSVRMHKTRPNNEARNISRGWNEINELRWEIFSSFSRLLFSARASRRMLTVSSWVHPIGHCGRKISCSHFLSRKTRLEAVFHSASDSVSTPPYNRSHQSRDARSKEENSKKILQEKNISR